MAEFLEALDPRDRAKRYAFGAGEEGSTTLLAVIAEGAAGGDPSLTNSREVRSGSPPAARERIVGFVSFGGSRDRDLPDHGEIRALYVDPERHRGGVGRMLMAEARRRLAADGYAEAFLWVLDGNERARGFYEREGWVADGARREENVYDIASNVSRFRRKVP